MTDEFDGLDEFDEVIGDDISLEVAEGEAPEIPGDAKKAKKVKKEKVVANYPKQVRVVAIGENTTLYPMSEFSVSLRTIANRLYVWTDPGKCLSWITRRMYNGESVSEGVVALKNQLSSLSSVRQLQRRLNAASEFLNSVALDNNRAWAKLATHAKGIDELLPEIDAVFSDLKIGVSQWSAQLNEAAQIEAPVSFQVVREASEELDANGDTVLIEAVTQSIINTDARADALADLKEGCRNLFEQRVAFNIPLDADTPATE